MPNFPTEIHITDLPLYLPPVREPMRLLPGRGTKLRRLTLWLLAIAPFCIGLLALALGQDANWDLRNYHWYNGWALATGRYAQMRDLLPSQTPFFYNPAIDVPFYWLASHAPAWVAGFILGTVQGLNVVLLFLLAHLALRIANPRHKLVACFALAVMGMLGGGGIAQIGTTFYDNVTSLGFFLSAVLVLRWQGRLGMAAVPRAFLWALLCGSPSGLMVGLKLPGQIFAIGLCAALLALRLPLRRRLLLGFGFGCGLLIGFLITYGYWGWYLQSHFANPLFPYFNQIFKSPLAPLSSARDTQYITRNWHDALFFPFVIAASPFRTGEIPFRDWCLPVLYALLPCAVVLRLIFGRSAPRRDAVATQTATRYLLWAVVIAYLVWLGLFCIYRYVVPLEMLAPLLIVLAAALLPLRPTPRALLTAFILLVIAATVQPGNWSRHPNWSDRFVETSLPPLGDMSQTVVLMAGLAPYAHLAPQFPAETRFLRLSSNFTHPLEAKGFNDLLHREVSAHRGNFMLLIPSAQHAEGADALRPFGLTPQWRACQTVTDRLYHDELYDLCPVN